MIHYVTMSMMGMSLNYDDFDMQELRDMEYIYLMIKQKEKNTFFEVLFKGFGTMFKNIMKGFRKR